MKYPTIFLVFIALVMGCASDNTSRSDTESQNSVIYIDPGKVADVTTGPYLLPYGMAKSMWEPSYLNDGTTDELAREVFAHTTFLEIWKQDSNRRTTTQPALDAMVHILDAGYLREAIWIKHQNLFTYQPAGLDLLGFKQWVDENPDLLIQPDAKLIVDVVPSQSKPEVIPPTSSGRTLGGTPDEVKPAVRSFSDAVAQLPNAQRSACDPSPDECSEPFVWDDVSKYARPSTYHSNKSVRSAYVRRSFILGKTIIYGRDLLRVDEDGAIKAFWPRKRNVQGNYGFFLKEDYLLHPNGTPMRVHLAKTQVVDGTVYPAETLVTLDDDGNILRDDLYPRIEANLREDRMETNIPTKLSSDRMIGVAVLPKGSLLYSDDRGYLHRALVPNTFVYDGTVVRTQEVYLSFTLDDKKTPYVSGFDVTEPMQVGGINIMPADVAGPSGNLRIDSAGMVLEAYLATDQTIDGWNLAARSSIQRYNDGGVRFGILSTNLRYKGSVIPGGSSVVVERDGTITEFSTPVRYKASTGEVYESGRIGLGVNGTPSFWQPTGY